MMKKIVAGYYQGEYKGIQFDIYKVGETKEKWWYWCIDDKPPQDWHSSKRVAIEAVKEYIAENY